MSRNTQRVDSIEPAQENAPSEERPPVDVFKLSDRGRGLVARIARLFGADCEDLAGRKDVFDGWANEVRELLGILGIERRFTDDLDDPRLGEWDLAPVPPDVSKAFSKANVHDANREARFGVVSGDWSWEAQDRRNRILRARFQEMLERALRREVAGPGGLADVDDAGAHEGATKVGAETTIPAAQGCDVVDASADVPTAAGEFAYLPRFRKDLMLSFAEVHGGREDLENEYRFLEDSVFRADVLKRIAEDDHPEDLRAAWHSNEVLKMYEDMYERSVEWFQGVLPGLLGFDHFPAYDGEVRPDSACTAED